MSNIGSAPNNIIIFEKITYFSIFLGMAIGFVTVPFFLLFVLFFGWIYIIQFAFMHFIVNKGSQTASNYYCLLCILATVGLIWNLYFPSFYSYRRPELYNYVLTWINVVVYVLSVILLSSKSSTRWFKEKSRSLHVEDLDFNGDRNVSSDSYKIYLSKKYKIEKSDVLGGYVLDDKIYKTSDEVFKEAMLRDTDTVSVKKSATKKSLKPEFTDAKCPNCESPVNALDQECWRCGASFVSNSNWRPIK